MEYSRLISVTGLSGLFELQSSKSDGAIVKSLETQAITFASNRQHNFSHLEGIEIYTIRENKNLVELFKVMDASSEALPNEKDNKAILAYFKVVFDEMDFDRVYDSDRRKMIKWFSILKKNNIEFKLSSETEEAAEK
jgi:Domain of unknown function (DUF5606)